MTCEEYRDWVAADVDGELGEETAGVRAHLESCQTCSAERRRHAAIRDTLRERPLRIEAPPELRSRIASALDLEDARLSGATRKTPRTLRWRFAPLGLAAAAILVWLVVGRGGSSFAPLIRSYDRATSGAASLAIRTDEPAELERFYAKEQGLPTHIVDLSGAGFRLVGGTIEDFSGRRARLSLYTDGEHWIVCDYHLAVHFPFELPADRKPVFFRERGMSFCARRIGDEVCLLATRMPLALLKQKLGVSSEG